MDSQTKSASAELPAGWVVFQCALCSPPGFAFGLDIVVESDYCELSSMSVVSKRVEAAPDGSLIVTLNERELRTLGIVVECGRS